MCVKPENGMKKDRVRAALGEWGTLILEIYHLQTPDQTVSVTGFLFYLAYFAPVLVDRVCWSDAKSCAELEDKCITLY